MRVDELPDDPKLLKKLLAEQEVKLIRQNAQLAEQNAELALRIAKLELELLRLKKRYYGPRADTLAASTDVAQLLLSFAQQIEQLPAEVEDLDAVRDDQKPNDLQDVQLPTARRIRKGRRNLQQLNELPTVRKEYDLPEEQKCCPGCGQHREQIGQETSWQIEYVPGHFERVEHVRLKYACRACEQEAQSPQIELADKPQQPIDKGMAGPGLLAFVVTSKFSDYTPLYRLEDLFGRSGFEVSRATMSLWCRDVATLLRPLYDLMVRRVLQSHVICTDDTTMPMLAPGKGKAHTARMWVYIGDEANPYHIFDFTLGRSRDGPAKFLKNFKETLLADGYGGYDGVVVGNDLVRAGCWAHARRKFVDAEKAAPAIAKEAVDLIGQLYDVERRAKEMDVAERAALRGRTSRPILDQLRQRLETWKQQLLPKHPMSEAVGYALRQWRELNVFVDDGAVPLDNNASERQMKRIVLNRKNSLFVGNERGGQTAAILSSLTSSCRRHEINPQLYLTQLLTNLPDTPLSQLSQWLPDEWKKRQTADTPPGKA